nr:MFS transporter [Ensifer aridi]
MRSFTTGAFLASTLVSNIGRNAYFVAATWLALLESNSVQFVTLLLLSGKMTEFLTSGAAGFVADSVDRRLACVAYDVLRILILTIAAFLFARGWGTAALFGSMILYSAADRGHLTAAQAMVPSIAPEGALVAMNSWYYLFMQAGNFVGAIATGWLLHRCTPSLVLGATSVCFVASSTATVCLRMPRCSDTEVHLQTSIRAVDSPSTASFFGSATLIFAAAFSLIYSMGMLINALLSSFVLKELGLKSFAFGQLEATWSIGSVVACLLLTTRYFEQMSRAVIFAIIVTSGLAMMSFAVVQTFAFALCQVVMLGALYNIGRILIDVDVQRTVPLPFIGRMKGLLQTTGMGFGAVVYGFMALAGDTLPASTAFGYFGVIMVAFAAAVYITRRRDRRMIHQAQDEKQ